MYTKIEAKLWKDPTVKKLDPDIKFLFLYLLTSPHRNIAGLYHLPKIYILADTGMSMETIEEGLSILLNKGLIRHDEESEMIFIKRFLRYNKIENKNQAISVNSRLDELTYTPLMLELRDFLMTFNVEKHQKIIDHIETLSKQYAKQEEVEVDVEVDVYEEEEGDGNEDGTQCSNHEGYQILLNQYNINCPSLMRKKSIDANMKQYLNLVYKNVFKANPIESIKFFQRVEASDHLAGRANDFKAEFEWLFKSENIKKVQSGKFDKY